MVAGGVTADTTPEETCEIMIEQMQKLTIEGLTGTMTWSATGEVSKTPTAVKIEKRRVRGHGIIPAVPPGPRGREGTYSEYDAR